jgi:hypothetical protein
MDPVVKKVTIDGEEYEVREMTLRQFSQLTRSVESSDAAAIKKVLIESTSIPEETLLDMYPSGMELLVDTVIEVNAPFLERARKLAMGDPEGLERVIRGAFILLSLS